MLHVCYDISPTASTAEYFALFNAWKALVRADTNYALCFCSFIPFWTRNGNLYAHLWKFACTFSNSFQWSTHSHHSSSPTNIFMPLIQMSKVSFVVWWTIHQAFPKACPSYDDAQSLHCLVKVRLNTLVAFGWALVLVRLVNIWFQMFINLQLKPTSIISVDIM